MDDVCLLDQMVAVLEKISGVSNACQNLFKVCSTFARLARTLAEARVNSVDSQSQTQDALQGFNEIDSGGLEQFEGLFGASMIEQLTNYESFSFSSMLGSWTGDEIGRSGNAPE